MLKKIGVATLFAFLTACGGGGPSTDTGLSDATNTVQPGGPTGVTPMAPGTSQPSSPDTATQPSPDTGVPTVPEVPPADTKSFTLTGMAAKGPVAYADVAVYAVINGTIGQVLATTATDVAGNYSVQVRAPKGPVVVKVSRGSYINEASGLQVPLTTTLRTILMPTDGNVVAHVTALTSVITRYAEQEEGGFTPANIEKARKAVRDWVGFDPVVTAPAAATIPASVTASYAERAHGFYLAALSQLLHERPESSLAQAIAELADWLCSGAQQAPVWWVKSADHFGWNPRNQSRIHNAQALANLSAILRSPPVLTPSVNTEPGLAITRESFTLIVVNKDSRVPQSTIDGLVENFFATYPALVQRFNPNAIRTVKLLVDPAPAFPGNAGYALGDEITIDANFIINAPYHLDLVVHESFHIVQAYAPYTYTPRWAVEGLANYASSMYGGWNAFTDLAVAPFPPGQDYTEGYAVAARFFRWLEVRKKAGIVDELNAAMRESRFSDTFWVEQTGKTLDTLWAEYAMNPQIF